MAHHLNHLKYQAKEIQFLRLFCLLYLFILFIIRIFIRLSLGQSSCCLLEGLNTLGSTWELIDGAGRLLVPR